MKIISKIKVHPMFYIFSLIIFVMGYFKCYMTFMLIILIHESGHILFSIFFKWRIDKIIILPFGCLIKFLECINKPIIEEFIISIMGIVFQLLFCLRVNIGYNLVIILFNLLPIYPLDGFKILNLFLNKISYFRKSYFVSFYISFISIILFIIYIIIIRDVISFMVVFPLLMGLIREYRGRYIFFNKFYLERYLYQFNFKKIKIIKNIRYMKRDYIHIIKDNDKYIKEIDFLKKLFDK